MLPLGRSRWIGGPTWSSEHESVVVVSGDVPAMLVNEEVMPPAQQDQIVQIGGTTLRPVLEMVDLEERCPPTSGKLTMMVTCLDLST